LAFPVKLTAALRIYRGCHSYVAVKFKDFQYIQDHFMYLFLRTHQPNSNANSDATLCQQSVNV